MTWSVLAWRDADAAGQLNMDRDRAMLHAVEAAPDHARVRVYGWNPACVSLGFHQDERELDLDAMRAVGLGWVRRPSGGAAILHAEEITFALAAPLALPTSRAVSTLYAPIAEAVLRALGAFDVQARCAGSGRPEPGACFASHGGHEILVGDRKICGIALRRGRRAYMAHGSLLVGDRHLELERFLPRSPVPDGLSRHATDLRREGFARERADELGERLLQELADTLRGAGRSVDLCGADGGGTPES